MHIFLFYNKCINACTCFDHYVLIIRRSELYYTASGIITPVGGRPVHRFVMCVSPSPWNDWASYERIFMKFDI